MGGGAEEARWEAARECSRLLRLAPGLCELHLGLPAASSRRFGARRFDGRADPEAATDAREQRARTRPHSGHRSGRGGGGHGDAGRGDGGRGDGGRGDGPDGVCDGARSWRW